MKKYRIEFGMTEVHKKKYYHSWVSRKSVSIDAPSDSQAEMLGRLKEGPCALVRTKKPPFEEVVIRLVMKHLYEITSRKVF